MGGQLVGLNNDRLPVTIVDRILVRRVAINSHLDKAEFDVGDVEKVLVELSAVTRDA